MLWDNGSKAPWHKFHLTKGRQSSSYLTSLNNLLVQFAKQSTCWSCCCERRDNVRPSFSERVAYFPNELLNFECSISFPFLIGRATTFYTFWNIDSRPILQNGMSSVLFGGCCASFVSKTVGCNIDVDDDNNDNDDHKGKACIHHHYLLL